MKTLYMTVTIHDDLAQRIREIVDNNGITIQGYVNALLEKALNSEIPTNVPHIPHVLPPPPFKNNKN